VFVKILQYAIRQGANKAAILMLLGYVVLLKWKTLLVEAVWGSWGEEVKGGGNGKGREGAEKGWKAWEAGEGKGKGVLLGTLLSSPSSFQNTCMSLLMHI
jgi:hypothetical protein